MNPLTKAQIKRRDILAHGKPIDYSRQQLEYFDGMTAAVALQLLTENLADPDDAQNDAPPFLEIANFLKDNPTFTASGYTVSPNRSDCRITLEEINHKGPMSSDEIVAFASFCRSADEFNLDATTGARAWWD